MTNEIFNQTKLAKMKADLNRGQDLTIAQAQALGCLLKDGDLIYVDESIDVALDMLFSGMNQDAVAVLQALIDGSGKDRAAYVFGFLERAILQAAQMEDAA